MAGSRNWTEEQCNIFRWYRAGWGRYTQADPVGVDGGLNLYSYTRGNPITQGDSLGLFGEYPPDLNELAKQLVCCVLRIKIDSAVRELNRRFVQENQMQRLLGDEVFKRTLFENIRQYVGHLNVYKNRQKNLQKLLKSWDKNDCGPRPPALAIGRPNLTQVSGTSMRSHRVGLVVSGKI